jgi:hypothetical protein
MEIDGTTVLHRGQAVPVVGRLPHRLGIILPSRDRQGRRLGAKMRARLRRRVADWFGEAFPGNTEDRMQIRPRLRGRWGVGPGVTVEEVEEVWSFCSAAELHEHKPGLVQLAEWVAREGDQQGHRHPHRRRDGVGGSGRDAMSVKELEAKLNRRLQEIHQGYAVTHLKRLPSGEYWFDLAMAFNPRDTAKVNRVFAELLGQRKPRPTVQAKFYLSQETYDRLRKRAASRGVKQSTLVEEALQSALA